MISLSLTVTATATDWYAEVGTGAMYLKLPKHGLMRASNPSPQLAPTVEGDNGEDVGGLLALRFGQVLPHRIGSADTSCVEMSGFYSSPDESEFEARPEPVSFSPVRSLGFFAKPAYLATLSAVDISTTREVDYFGIDSLLRQNHRWSHNDILSVYGGFSTRFLQQDLSTFVVTESNTVFADLSEALDTDYYGAKMGVMRLRTLSPQWTSSLEGNLGFYAASTDYDGSFAVDSFVNDPPISLSDSAFAIGTQLKLTLTRQFGSSSFISIYGTFEHLNYAPEIRFVNEEQVTNPNPPPTRIIADELMGAMLGIQLSIFR